MLIDEQQHSTKALEAGGVDFSDNIKSFMATTSKVMTKTTYHL
jgi:ubiquinone biosynthesis monooxygenase Coq7